MTLKDIEYFVVMAREKSISRAAEQLFVAQPALSQCLQKIEKETGVELVIRSSSGVTLTSEGDWLNTEIIDFLNQVLKTEGDNNRLHIVSEGWDQLVFLIYGTEADAKALRRLLDVEEPASSVGESLLDWLGSLFGQ